MTPKKEYRPLHVPVPRPRAINERFALLAGLSIAIVFLACVMMAYFAQRH